MGAMRVVSAMSVGSVMAVGQNVPEGGEMTNPMARTPLGVRGMGY